MFRAAFARMHPDLGKDSVQLLKLQTPKNKQLILMDQILCAEIFPIGFQQLDLREKPGGSKTSLPLDRSRVEFWMMFPRTWCSCEKCSVLFAFGRTGGFFGCETRKSGVSLVVCLFACLFVCLFWRFKIENVFCWKMTEERTQAM